MDITQTAAGGKIGVFEKNRARRIFLRPHMIRWRIPHVHPWGPQTGQDRVSIDSRMARRENREIMGKALWNVRKRHEALAAPLKPRRVKRRTRLRCGLEAALLRKAPPVREEEPEEAPEATDAKETPPAGSTASS